MGSGDARGSISSNPEELKKYIIALEADNKRYKDMIRELETSLDKWTMKANSAERRFTEFRNRATEDLLLSMVEDGVDCSLKHSLGKDLYDAFINVCNMWVDNDD